ncbi:calcium-binding protein [Streptomyces californicus]
MRKLAIGIAASGALALTGLAAPAASAATTPNLVFSDVTVNNGKAVTVGTTATVKVPVTYTLTRPSDLTVDYRTTFAGVLLTRTPSRMANEIDPEAVPTCTATATTDTTVTESCKEILAIDPGASLYSASDATAWKAAGLYSTIDQDDDDSDGHISLGYDYDAWGPLGSGVQIKRAAKLTADAAPEPVKKGATLTVTGKLTRADWDSGRYTGYVSQKATLQFRAKGASGYTTVKTVTSGTGGVLRTTTKATKDGYYRYVFAGTTTTGSATAAGDDVDVR